MGIAQISEDNRALLLEAMKKLNLDKKLKEEGIEQGATENEIKIAENFLNMGLSVEQVAKGSELSIEKIIELKKKMMK